MFQVYLPYTVTIEGPLKSKPAFCTGNNNKTIAFTSVEKVSAFVKRAKDTLGIKLEWGAANSIEFPGLENVDFELDPNPNKASTSIW